MKSFITLLNQTILELLGETDTRLVAKGFTDTGMKILGADFGFIWLRVGQNGAGNYVLVYKSPNTPYSPPYPRRRGINARVYKTKSPFFATKIPRESSAEYDVSSYMKSFVIIPITYQNRIYGNAVFCFKKLHHFSKTDKNWCAVLGHTLAQAITINNLHNNLQKIKHTLDHTAQPNLIFDPRNQTISHYNQSLLSQSALTKKQLARAKFKDVLHPSVQKTVGKKLAQIIADKIPSSVFETILLGPNQRKVPVEIFLQYVSQPGQPPHLFAIFRDLQEQRKTEEQIKQAAFHDTLTGLPNRFLFTQKLDALLLQSKQKKRKFAVMFLDLDRFKFINDTAGHLMGDSILQQIAERLKNTIKRTDTVSRLGGDEFVILLPNLRSTQQTDQVAQRIQRAFLKPFKLPHGQEVYMNFSMGISTFPTDGLDAETLLKNADNALYRTKQESGNSYQHYHSGMVNLQLSHLDMEKNLRKAIAENQLRLYYQPIIGLRTGKVKSVEALVRWEHPTLGLILPEIFIPYAEDSGLIIRLDQWVHEESFRQLKIWRKAGLNTPININTSPPELVQKNMIRKLETGLKKHGLTPQDIILELTETFLIKDMNKSVNAIQEIKQAGFRTALDDFGTGFASINYLRRLPVTYIKIDQVFVSGCVKNKEDAGIIQAMIAVAHHLNIKVIAEGVENRAQAEFLKKHGCDRVQGNYYSPPLSAERVTTILKKKYKV